MILSKKKSLILLFLILVLGAYLRFSGLHWGLPSASMQHPPFHSDEIYVASVIQQVDFAHLRGQPDGAHREGTAIYYIWILGSVLMYLFGGLTQLPINIQGYNQDYANLIYMGRVIGQSFDLGSVILVYLILTRITQGFIAPLLGALVLAIYPFEVIHGHYMRPHVPANFFALFLVWSSLKLYEKQNWSPRAEIKAFCWLGLVAGFTTAARYTYGVIAILFPIMLIAYRETVIKNKQHSNFSKKMALIFNKNLAAILGSSVVGLFIGDPFLFLRFKHAREHMITQASYTGKDQFGSVAQIFDLSKVSEYIFYVIPYSALPLLWVLIYCSIIYLFFQRKFFKYTLPLFIVCTAYLIPVAKGYLNGIQYVRPTIFLYPFFAIFVGLAFSSLWPKLHSRHRTKYLLSICIVSVCSFSVFYDYKYVEGMKQTDPRFLIYDYLKDRYQSKPIRVWVKSNPEDPMFSFFSPPIFSKEKIVFVKTLLTPDKSETYDYVILGVDNFGFKEAGNKEIATIIATEKYELVQRFEKKNQFFGNYLLPERTFWDLYVPFPVFAILAKKQFNTAVIK